MLLCLGLRPTAAPRANLLLTFGSSLMLLTLAGCAERAPAGVVPPLPIARIEAVIEGAPASCSGVLVAPRVVLTAAHCRPLAESTDAVIVLGAERHRVVEAERHLRRDLALVVLDRPSALLPLALATRSPTVGERVEVAGARDGGWRGAHAVLAVTDLRLVAAAEHHPVCAGDSGGPLLVSEHGAPRIAGVLSTGSVGCDGRGTFTRTDAARDWIAERIRE